MLQSMPVLVAPDAFAGALRAPEVAAAIGRGLERAGVTPLPELRPVASGGAGTIEVLLPALGGETADGFALVEDGATAIVEAAGSSARTGQLVAAAVDTGAAVVVVAAGAGACDDGGAGAGACGDGGAGAIVAIEQAGGLRGATLVVLCDVRDAWRAGDAAALRRDPRDVAMTGTGGGLAGALWAQFDARLVAAAPFVLQALDFDARMRAARAVIVGERRLDRGTMAGRVTGEIATRARQSGVPCHAVVGERALDRFDARILDLQAVFEASSLEQIEAAGEALAEFL
jgi:glycerate 2-kinase